MTNSKERKLSLYKYLGDVTCTGVHSFGWACEKSNSWAVVV